MGLRASLLRARSASLLVVLQSSAMTATLQQRVLDAIYNRLLVAVTDATERRTHVGRLSAMDRVILLVYCILGTCFCAGYCVVWLIFQAYYSALFPGAFAALALVLGVYLTVTHKVYPTRCILMAGWCGMCIGLHWSFGGVVPSLGLITYSYLGPVLSIVCNVGFRMALSSYFVSLAGTVVLTALEFIMGADTMTPQQHCVPESWQIALTACNIILPGTVAFLCVFFIFQQLKQKTEALELVFASPPPRFEFDRGQASWTSNRAVYPRPVVTAVHKHQPQSYMA